MRFLLNAGAAATAEASTVVHPIATKATTSADEEVLPTDTADVAAAEEAAAAAEGIPQGRVGSLDPAAQPGIRKKRNISGDAISTMLLAHTFLHCQVCICASVYVHTARS